MVDGDNIDGPCTSQTSRLQGDEIFDINLFWRQEELHMMHTFVLCSRSKLNWYSGDDVTTEKMVQSLSIFLWSKMMGNYACEHVR
jgi:hypothetical protein